MSPLAPNSASVAPNAITIEATAKYPNSAGTRAAPTYRTDTIPTALSNTVVPT